MEKAILALADGTTFEGYAFGARVTADKPAVGEITFNTSTYGYQEIITDVASAGQIICFTYPHIGNYGCTSQDMESSEIRVAGVIVKSLSLIASNFRSEEDLNTFLSRNHVMGINDLPTRALVQHVRDNGSQMAAMAVYTCEDDKAALIKAAKNAVSYDSQNFVNQMTTKEIYDWNELPWSLADNAYKKLSQNKMWSRPHLVTLDCGVARSVLRNFLQVGFRITVVPATYTAEQIMALSPDALYVSSGAGNPLNCKMATATVTALLGKLPIFGTALGYQIIALALGAKVKKLKFGQHGGQPVRNLLMGTAEVCAHNTDYVVESDSLPRGVKATHINLNDKSLAGLECPALKASGLQYVPSSWLGPQEAETPYARFFESVVGYKKEVA